MKRILFTGKQLRVRRRETILHPPEGITFVAQQDLKTMKADHQLSNYDTKESLFQKLKNGIHYGNCIPRSFLKNIDMIYSPGKLIFNRFPYVIELDNLGALTYYRLPLLFILKPLIRWKLESKYCKGIVCLSKACEKSVQEFFKSNKINKKTATIYPYVKNHENVHNVMNTIKLLYSSTNFYLKGGKEILSCMKKIRSNKLKLTIITKAQDLKHEHLQQIEEDKRITLVESNLDVKTIAKKFYITHDILIVPTYQDSFGMVFLEAIANGMSIISTNQYNVPELVVQNKTGFLITPPYYYFHKDTNIPNKKIWCSNHHQRVREEPFPNITLQLQKIIIKIIHNPQLVTELKQKSKEHYEKNFNEEKRIASLKKILER